MRVGLLSKITRSGCFSSSKSSAFLQSNSKPLNLPSFSPHSTLLRSHSWKICSPNGVSGTILAKRFFSNALLKRIPGEIRNGRLLHSITSLNRTRRSFFGRFTPKGVVIGLILTNVAVFMLWRFADTQFMRQNFMVSVDNFTSGRVHTLITYAFSHFEPSYLISNMIGLYFFGTSIGHHFGAQYLLKLYLGGAISGSVFYVVYLASTVESFQSNQTGGLVSLSKISGLGASGAVNAIMLLDIFLHPTRTIFFDWFIPIPAILLGVVIIFGRDDWRVWQGDPLVSGSTRLGGATVAALAWFRARKRRFRRF